MATLTQTKGGIGKKELPHFKHINLESECLTDFTSKWAPKLEYMYVLKQYIYKNPNIYSIMGCCSVCVYIYINKKILVMLGSECLCCKVQ